MQKMISTRALGHGCCFPSSEVTIAVPGDVERGCVSGEVLAESTWEKTRYRKKVSYWIATAARRVHRLKCKRLRWRIALNEVDR